MDAMTGFYPVVMVADARRTAAFFVDHFGFQTTFDADWYVSLRRDVFELALLRHDHETVPAGHRRSIAGLLLNYEVEDAHAAYDRLVRGRGLELARDIRDEDFGQRHFIVVGPEGVLVDVIENIPVSGTYAGAPVPA